MAVAFENGPVRSERHHHRQRSGDYSNHEPCGCDASSYPRAPGGRRGPALWVRRRRNCVSFFHDPLRSGIRRRSPRAASFMLYRHAKYYTAPRFAAKRRHHRPPLSGAGRVPPRSCRARSTRSRHRYHDIPTSLRPHHQPPACRRNHGRYRAPKRLAVAGRTVVRRRDKLMTGRRAPPILGRFGVFFGISGIRRKADGASAVCSRWRWNAA